MAVEAICKLLILVKLGFSSPKYGSEKIVLASNGRDKAKRGRAVPDALTWDGRGMLQSHIVFDGESDAMSNHLKDTV